MYSLQFPDMFTANKTNLVQDKSAAGSNLKLLLGVTKRELFGDPDFGTNLKMFLMNQMDTILQDLVIDEIYTAIRIYIPQIEVNRNDITIEFNGKNLVSAKVVYKYIRDKETNMFEIPLIGE